MVTLSTDHQGDTLMRKKPEPPFHRMSVWKICYEKCSEEYRELVRKKAAKLAAMQIKIDLFELDEEKAMAIMARHHQLERELNLLYGEIELADSMFQEFSSYISEIDQYYRNKMDRAILDISRIHQERDFYFSMWWEELQENRWMNERLIQALQELRELRKTKAL